MVKFKYARPAAGSVAYARRVANLVLIVFHADYMVEIHETGVRVFD